MSIFELIITAFALAMDAFAVSICKGLSVKKLMLSHMVITGLYFGGFQALMPTIGYFLGASFKDYITSIDHWIAFALLALIGANMVKESFGEAEEQSDSFTFKAMLPLAIATSIDALAVGVGFAFLEVNILFAALAIGVITFATSAIGVKIGNVFGCKYKSKADLVGGIVLIAMGLKILIQGLMETV